MADPVPEPDPKDPNHFAGSGSKIIVSDPEPDPKGTFYVLVPVLSKVVKQTSKSW